MRGEAATQATMLTAVTPDALVPQSHPIRRIKPMVDSALAALSPTFSRMYASVGRPSIPPEHLLKGCLLMVYCSPCAVSGSSASVLSTTCSSSGFWT